MVTLTVDPLLFPDPKTAYLYLMKKRCISVTIQDLDRRGHLATRKYFYVVEWQMASTQLPHFHVLCDTTYIPWETMVESWSKHRPKDAGPVMGNRPVFGYVAFTAPKFESPVHAARYATKYLTKFPKKGFPGWVMNMGKGRRVRRYSASRGFWGTASPKNTQPKTSREGSQKTYRERVGACGDSVHVFQMGEYLDRNTGELTIERVWLGQLEADASLIDRLWDPGEPARRRRSLLAQSPLEVRRIIENATGQRIEWRHRRRIYFYRGVRPLFPLPVVRCRKYPKDYVLPGVLSDE
jgi:hypothetical protein